MKKHRLYLVLILISVILVSALYIIYNTINSIETLTKIFINSSENISKSLVTSINNKIKSNKATSGFIEDIFLNPAKLIASKIKEIDNLENLDLEEIISLYSIGVVKIFNENKEMIYSSSPQLSGTSGKGLGLMKFINNLLTELFNSDEKYISSTRNTGIMTNPRYGYIFAYKIDNNLAIILNITEESIINQNLSIIYKNLSISEFELPETVKYVLLNNELENDIFLISNEDIENDYKKISEETLGEYKEIIYSHNKETSHIKILEMDTQLHISKTFQGIITIGLKMDTYYNLKSSTIFNYVIIAIIFIILLIVVVFFLNKFDRAETISALNKEKYESLIVMSGQMAHEIRNPLNSISMIAKRMEYEYDSEGVEKQSINLLYDKINLINTTIEDCNNLTKKIKLEIQNVNIKDFFNEIIKAYEKEYAKIKIKGEIENANFCFDPIKIKQVIGNILINSIQAMKDKGIINLEVNIKNNKLNITIFDTGRGISEKIMKNLYTPFQTTKANGSGLGLTIIKRIVDAHNGTIKIENVKDIGAKINILIPRIK